MKTSKTGQQAIVSGANASQSNEYLLYFETNLQFRYHDKGTAFNFTVASGNVSNQRVNAHAMTTIAAGKVQGKSEEGRTISGTCKDGGDLVIKEQNGVPLLMPVGGGKKKK